MKLRHQSEISSHTFRGAMNLRDNSDNANASPVRETASALTPTLSRSSWRPDQNVSTNDQSLQMELQRTRDYKNMWSLTSTSFWQPCITPFFQLPWQIHHPLYLCAVMLIYDIVPSYSMKFIKSLLWRTYIQPPIKGTKPISKYVPQTVSKWTTLQTAKM